MKTRWSHVQPLRRLWADRDGTALVEGAIVVPVLALLLFGVFEFSWLFYEQHLISTGLRDAARYLARTPDPTDSTWQTNAKNIATTGTFDGSGTVRVTGWVAADVTCSALSIANPVDGQNLLVTSGATDNQVITCSTSWSYPTLGMFGFLGLTAGNLVVAHSQRAILDSVP
jgi:Flp pilus assembly protein TadG